MSLDPEIQAAEVISKSSLSDLGFQHTTLQNKNKDKSNT